MKASPNNLTNPTISQIEETMRLIMKSALDAIVCIDGNGVITVWTPQAEKIFGWTEKEIIGKSLTETIIPAQYRDLHTKGFSNYLKTGEGRVLNNIIEITGLDKQGKEFPIELTITPINQGDQRFFCAFIRDITERKKAEEDTRISELRYRSLIDQASDAIMITDTKGTFLDINTSFCKNFGFEKEELIGFNVSKVIDAEQLKNEPIRFDLLMAGQSIIRERKMIHKDGHIIEVEANVKMIPDGRILAIARDITERKKANTEIEASEKKLRQVLASTTDNFYVIDRNYNIILINEIAEKNLSIAWGQPISLGTNILNVAFVKNDEPILENFEKVFSGARIEYELHHDRPDLPAWTQVSIMPVSDENGMITGAYVIAKDISERKKVAELVIRERDLSDTIINSLPGIFYLMDENRKYLRWNKNMEEVLNLTTEEMSKQVPGAAVIEEDKSKVAETINRVFKEGYASVEARMLSKNGEQISYYLTGIRSTYENRPCLLGTGIDITALKKAEQERLETEERYRALVENATEALVVMDVATGKFVSVSDSAAKLFKMSKEDLLKIGPVEVSPDYQPGEILSTKMATEKIGEAVAGAKLNFEWTHKDSEGNLIPCEVWLVRLPSENQVLIRGSIIDITERKKAEKELKDSEQKYKLLFESNPLPMLMFSRTDYVILDVNDAAINLYGYSHKEFRSMKMTDLRPEEDVSEFKIKSALPIVGNANLGVWKHVKKDGTIIRVEINGHDIIYQGKPARLVLSTDVTEKMEAEEKLKHSYKEVRELTEHLQQIREQERTNIAREIHDELGQQLTVLKMDASWLTKKLSASDESIKEKLKDLMQLLDGTVKSVRRISAELRPSLLDDLGLVAAIEWHLQEFGKRSGILTFLEVERQDLSIPEELKTGLYRIFQESLTNVARHAKAKRVKVYLHSKDNEIILSIEDDGEGFDKLKASGKKTLGILGMEERTNMMGGHYRISSSPGNGTKVSVSVPNTPIAKT